MNDTPRTDRQLENRGSMPVTTAVGVDFARQLERELAEALLPRSEEVAIHAVTKDRDQLKADMITQGLALCEERDVWRAMADQLFAIITEYQVNDSAWQQAKGAYEKLKGQP